MGAVKHHLTAAAIADLPEQIIQHPVNPNAVRNSRAVGDVVGLQKLGLHLVRLKPGRDSTEFHFHHGTDEFIYVLEGRGTGRIGEQDFEVNPGDCLGFPAQGPAHVLSNPFDADLLYLCGGNRATNDVCDYPEAGKRLYVSGKDRHLEALIQGQGDD